MSDFFDSETDSFDTTRRHLLDSLRFPLTAVGAIWFFFVFEQLTGSDWAEWGIYPRKIWGITGVVTSPLVHGSWSHLISNSMPLFVLTTISVYFYKKVASRAFWMIYFLTGVCVWAVARPVYHIGASGVVYGLVAFICWNGMFRRSIRSIILALIVIFLYSGMFIGILPSQEGVSWESHLCGALVGIFTSYWYKGELEEDEKAEDRHHASLLQTEELKYYIPRDAFVLTKAERARLEEEERRRALEEAEMRRLERDNERYLPPPIWYSDWTGQ